MSAVHIRIRHDDDLVIAKLRDIKIVPIPFRKTAAERIDHGFDLGIGKHLVDTGLLHIQNLPADRKNCLISPVSGGLGASSRRISLHDKDFAFGGVPGLAVRKLSIGIKGKLLFGEHIRLRLFLALADLRRLFRTAYDRLERVQIPVKVSYQLLGSDLAHHLCGVLIIELGLGLSLEPRIRMLDRDHGGNPVSHVRSGKICILFLQDIQFPGIRIDNIGEGGLEAGQVGSALRIIDIVAKAKHILMKFVDVLERSLHRNPFALACKIDNIMERLF